mgnify:CR=1 FL=1
MAVLSTDVQRKVLEVARRSRDNPTAKIAVGRRLLIKRHCGERMVQVKFYYPDGPGREMRGSDLHVCVQPDCSHAEIPWWQEPDPN